GRAKAAADAVRTQRLLRRSPRQRGAVYRSLRGLGLFQYRLQLAAGKHFTDDVGTADEFALDVELGDSGPVGIFLDALTHFFVVEHVHRNQLGGTGFTQGLDGAAGETALGKLCRTLHEQHDRVRGNGFADEILDFAHGG